MSKKLKLLYVDIETSPNVGYFWRPGSKISIGHENIVEERRIICLSYKWEGNAKVYSIVWDGKQDDKKLLKTFLEVAGQAEFIVTHNGDRFDIPWIKGRLAVHGLSPLTNLVSIDTLKLCRSNFGFNSNKLAYIGKLLVNDSKLKHSGFSLWKDVLKGDKKALKDMVKYCEQDVKLLEKVFNKIKPYVKSMPSLTIAKGGSKDHCPNCASSMVIYYGNSYTQRGKKQRYKCMECDKTWS